MISTYEKMTKSKIRPLLIKLSIPTVVSMLITSIYNMADTFFVSKIDTSASASMNIVFSLQSLIQAIGFTLGMGCGSLISRSLGKKNKDDANKLASNTFLVGLIIGLIVLIFGSIFTRPFMKMLGASDTAIDYSVDYARFIFIACPFMILSFIMNNILRSEGHSNLSMIGLGVGGILNIFLDPLFIFAFGLSVSGAGLATAISQIISFLILLSMFILKKSETNLSVKYLDLNFKRNLLVLKTGSPTLFRQGCQSIANIILNFLGKPYGDACIAAIGIANKIYQVIRSVVIGIGQGFQPILGYNYGAKENERIKIAFRFTLLIQTLVCIIASIIILIFPVEIVKAFRNDESIIFIGKYAVRFLAISLPFLGFSSIINQSLQVTGFSLCAAFLASLRQGLLFIPIVFIMNNLLSAKGLCLTQPLSDLFTAIISIPFLILFFKKLKKNI